MNSIVTRLNISGRCFHLHIRRKFRHARPMRSKLHHLCRRSCIRTSKLFNIIVPESLKQLFFCRRVQERVFLIRSSYSALQLLPSPVEVINFLILEVKKMLNVIDLLATTAPSTTQAGFACPDDGFYAFPGQCVNSYYVCMDGTAYVQVFYMFSLHLK